jgi:hypothetical protein
VYSALHLSFFVHRVVIRWRVYEITWHVETFIATHCQLQVRCSETLYKLILLMFRHVLF